MYGKRFLLGGAGPPPSSDKRFQVETGICERVVAAGEICARTYETLELGVLTRVGIDGKVRSEAVVFQVKNGERWASRASAHQDAVTLTFVAREFDV